ncbi:hypothetical protein GC088_02015 [Arthrobacter sp. JZ12]|uniref:hypothetical protein n=1 Tax=Arthrobacter sp. JZ12 TaxID=2654190 RepID=UPI002B493B2F|nr:hypothetical protein [Arthrobacter sp. JZ12]WRH24008.1 hypothetical protein GC088_02015 [Arthrobacter sp. JZ12]
MNVEVASLLAQVIPVFVVLINVEAAFVDLSSMRLWLRRVIVLVRWVLTGFGLTAVVVCVHRVYRGDRNHVSGLIEFNEVAAMYAFLGLVIFSFLMLFAVHSREAKKLSRGAEKFGSLE